MQKNFINKPCNPRRHCIGMRVSSWPRSQSTLQTAPSVLTEAAASHFMW